MYFLGFSSRFWKNIQLIAKVSLSIVYFVVRTHQPSIHLNNISSLRLRKYLTSLITTLIFFFHIKCEDSDVCGKNVANWQILHTKNACTCAYELAIKNNINQLLYKCIKIIQYVNMIRISRKYTFFSYDFMI